jgi:hypothetical protein
MADQRLTIVGVFKDGKHIVLADADRKQYACGTPQELWDDLMAIIADKALPGTVISQEQVDGDEDILKDACDQVRDVVGEHYGRFWGRLAGEATKKVGPLTLKTLRNVSKGDRFGRRRNRGSR